MCERRLEQRGHKYLQAIPAPPVRVYARLGGVDLSTERHALLGFAKEEASKLRLGLSLRSNDTRELRRSGSPPVGGARRGDDCTKSE